MAPEDPSPASTPRPWPENAHPTPEQLAEWLTRCTDEERVTLCSRMLDSADRADRCFVENHAVRALVEAVAPLMDRNYCQPFGSAWELDPHVGPLGRDGEVIYEQVRAAWERAKAALTVR